MLQQVYEFVKNPNYIEDENKDFSYRVSVLVKILLWGLTFGIIISMANSIWELTGILDSPEHAMETALKESGLPVLFLMAVVAAPLLEELFFRGPLWFFRNSKFFRIVFYASIILFGLVHITNFELSPTVLALTPFLVAPQLCLGAFAGFIRVRFGILWSIALHALYNFVLFVPIILMQLLDIPIE